MDIADIKNIDIRAVDLNTLVDIRNTIVNTDLPKDERIKDFIRQIKNPYCYRCGKVAVKISFSDTLTTLEEKLENYLMSL